MKDTLYNVFKLIPGTILLTILLQACTTGGKLSTWNFAEAYNPDSNFESMQCQAFQSHIDSLKIFLKLDETRFEARDESETGFYADYSISFLSFSDEGMRHPMDTFRFDFNNIPFVMREKKGERICALPYHDDIKAIDILLNDRNSDYEDHLVLYPGHQDFLFLPMDTLYNVLYSPLSVKSGLSYFLRTRVSGKFNVEYYRESNEIASPPFVTTDRVSDENMPDSVFQIRVMDDSVLVFRPFANGIYVLSPEEMPGLRQKFSVFGKSYPKLATSEEMLMPLRYITSADEFIKLANAPVLKTAIDSFWVFNSGNAERALGLLRNYYKRVEEANRFFSSAVRGWQTDRGLIYIMYGMPDVVYRSARAESWIYGGKNDYNSLRFNFFLKKDAGNLRDMQLEPQTHYRSSWYPQADKWRR